LQVCRTSYDRFFWDKGEVVLIANTSLDVTPHNLLG